VALPFALVVTLAMVILASDMGIRTQHLFDLSRKSLRLAESRSLQRKMERILIAINRPGIESLSASERAFRIDQFDVAISFEVMESRINISRLNDLTLGPQIQGLFGALLKRERLEARALPCAMDWVDADDEPRQSGAEKNDYIGEDVAPRNGPFEMVDELSFVRGFRDVSAFDRLRPILTTFGSGRIYLPAAPDELLDLFEDVYGPAVRNNLDDIRRNPARTIQLPAAVLAPQAQQFLQAMLLSAPTTWLVRIRLSAPTFEIQSEYVLTLTDEAGGYNRLVRIA